MDKLFRYTVCMLVIVCCGLLVRVGIGENSCSIVQAAETLQEDEGNLLSIEGKSRPLRELIEEIAAQSGYRIEISESLLTTPVTGKYRNVDIASFFNRIFKGSNIFQVIDQKNKVIRLLISVREKTPVLVVEKARDKSVVESRKENRLDGNPEKTFEDLLSERKRESAWHDPADQRLDGNPEKRYGELLEERGAFFNSYDMNTVTLDGEPGKTMGELLQERTEVFEQKAARESEALDGEPDKTTRDLFEERRRFFETYDPNAQPLDGEPDKTFQDLLDERDRVFGK